MTVRWVGAAALDWDPAEGQNGSEVYRLNGWTMTWESEEALPEQSRLSFRGEGELV